MLFFAPSTDAAKIFDAAVAAHAKLTRVNAHVTLDAQVAGSRQQSTYDVQIDGSKILVRVRQPRHRGEDRSDRTYYFVGDKLLAYDPYANEKLSRNLPTGVSRLEQVLFVFGTVPDLIRGLFAPKEMQAFLDQTRKVGGWSPTRKHGMDLLIRKQPGSKRLDVLGFDPARHLLRRVDVGTTESGVRWTFDYKNPLPITFKPPAGARIVTAFTVAPEPPTYLSKEAEKVTKAMLDAEARLGTGLVTIDGSDGKIRLALNGKSVREDGPHVTYAYDGKTLTILNHDRHTFYRGSAIRSTIPDLVAQIGAGVDPFARQIFQHRIPFREALRANMRVSLAGEITAGDGPCDILSLDGGRTKVTMFVRRRDHLVSGMMTSIFDDSGQNIAASNRRFRYEKLGKVQFVIQPKAGQTVSALPELKIGR